MIKPERNVLPQGSCSRVEHTFFPLINRSRPSSSVAAQYRFTRNQPVWPLTAANDLRRKRRRQTGGQSFRINRRIGAIGSAPGGIGQRLGLIDNARVVLISAIVRAVVAGCSELNRVVITA